MQPIFYAIGDIHGEAERLKRLHRYIFERHSVEHSGLPLTIIHLGDYVDRGPESYNVLDYLLNWEPPDGVTAINLKGNHEQMMLAAADNAEDKQFWLSNGGADTVKSYKAAGYEDVPDTHLNWLRDLPHLHVDNQAKLIFVHAGIDVSIWPEQREDVHLWTRSPRFFAAEQWVNPALEGWCVIHGHTPTDDFFPERSGTPERRINVDTGACFGGRLTAAKVAPGQSPRFIYA